MKIFNKIKIERIKNNTDGILDENKIDDVLLKALINGETIDRDKALNIPVVSSCVDLICDTFAMIPFKLYKETEKDGKIKTEEVNDSRVDIINYDTKDTLDGFQFKKAMCEDYLLGQGAYAYIKKKRNLFLGLNYVEEKYVQTQKNTDRINKEIELIVDRQTYKSYEFIKLLRNTKDGASGIGLINKINKALETAYQRMILESDLMKTCGNKKGFLRALKHLDDKAMKALKNAWNEYYAGNSSCVILNDGMEFKEASNTSVENQLNEKAKTFSDEIKDVFHIESNYDNFLKKAIMPIATAFCTALNKDFLLEKEKNYYYFAPDMTELLKGSLKERYEAYKIAIEKGWMSRNEVRYKEDMDEIEGLDIFNLGLGDVLLNPKTGEIYTPNTDSTKQIEGGE